MKKYLFMMVALLVAFTSFALVSCGDDDDDPVQPKVNTYKFILKLTETEKGQIDEFKTIFPDLTLTYKLPGKPAVSVPAGKDIVEASSETTETGSIEIKYTGTLDESKLDETKKYSFVPMFEFYIHQDGYTSQSVTPETKGFSGMLGSIIKEKHSKFEYTFHKSLIKPTE